MKLNKKVELGIKTLNALKNHDKLVRLSDLAVEIGTTAVFLTQIMRNLRQADLVLVKRGPGGGYELNRAIGDITAYQVARAVGRFSDNVAEVSTDPTNKLRQSIVNAFLNTTI